MSILTKSNNNVEETTPSFHDFKKQASFFFKEKIKKARLALTDVTPAELLTEEAINGNPDTMSLRSISKAAFELDDYWRIVGILHKRLLKFEKKYWRISYNSLIVVEHLLTHGPESVAEEFQIIKDVVTEIESFQHIDEKGFNWGLAVRKKSERILKLLENGPLLKQEKDRARKLTREIQGFGSVSHRSSSQGILKESSSIEVYGRNNSQFNSTENQEEDGENQGLILSTKCLMKFPTEQKQNQNEFVCGSGSSENFNSWGSEMEKPKAQGSFKENVVPIKEELHEWNPLLDGKKDEYRDLISNEDDHLHPFNHTETQTTVSLLSG